MNEIKLWQGDKLASFRMAVNGVEIISPKSASIIISAPYGSGGVNKGLLKPINVYVRKIFIYKTSTNCRKHVHWESGAPADDVGRRCSVSSSENQVSHKRKTSLLLAYIDILPKNILLILVLFVEFVTSILFRSLYFTSRFAFVIRWNDTLVNARMTVSRS